MLEETHKSAFITIRKKLIKDEPTAVIEPVSANVDQEKRLNDKINLENGLLKQEINDLKTKCANLEIEIGEREVKNESLDEQIVTLEDKLENAFGESRKLTGRRASIFYGIWIKQSSAMVFISNLNKISIKKLFPTMNI